MRHILLLSVGLVAGSCELAELETPKAGTCPQSLTNAWPKFEALEDGEERPEFTNIGYNEGQVPPDFLSTDQNGEEVCLWQMYGKYVILDASALWCEPCREIAETVACTQESLGDEVVYMTFITEGSTTGVPATDDDVQQWSSFFGLGEGTQTPVVNDAGEVFTDPFPGDGLPSLVLLGPDLRVIMSGEGQVTEVAIKNELKKRLGKDSVESCEGGGEE